MVDLKRQEGAEAAPIGQTKEKDLESEMGSSYTGKVREMEYLLEKDEIMKKYEDEYVNIARKQLFPDGKEYSDSMSNISNFSNTNSKGGINSASKEKDEFLNLDAGQKYKAERTSLLHGSVQYDKYPEAYANLSKDDENLFENCDKEYSPSYSAAYFEQLGQRPEEDIKFYNKDYGIRRRDEGEISLATRRLEAERKKQQRTQNEELINDNSELLSSLTELNKDMKNQSDLITYSHQQKVVSSAAGMRMIDLKQQRESQLRGYHKSNKDYQEKAIDTEKEEKDADAAANDDG